MVSAPPAPALRPLSRRRLPRDTLALARFLIGKTLVRSTAAGLMAGRIVETEAYLPSDAASHAFRGKTKRNRSMFLRRGHAYVYFIYGTWFSLNVSAEDPGVGAAVLIRALEPTLGLEQMRRLRPHARDHELAAGPGRLATALAIDFSLDGVDLCGPGGLWLGPAPYPVPRANIGQSVRIGITKAADRPWRFFEKGHASVSGPRRLSRMPPASTSTPVRARASARAAPTDR